MPGTYQAAAPVVCIRSFAQTMIVIPSKQRPRKLKGADSAAKEAAAAEAAFLYAADADGDGVVRP